MVWLHQGGALLQHTQADHRHGLSGCLNERREWLLKDALLGDVQVEGNLLDIKCFVGYFDFAETPIALMVDWTLWRSSNLLKCGHAKVAPI
jgi:hypothetical protein